MTDQPATVPASRVPARKPFLLGLLIGALLAFAISGAIAAWRTSSASDRMSLWRNGRAEGVVTTPSGLQYKVLTPGKGAKPTDSDVALINYEGKLLDGTSFDKSQRPTPLPVTGAVKGFGEGLKLMPKGAKYRFWIKPELGYGDKATGPIPANATLVFDVELLDFLPEAVLRQMQAAQMGGARGGAPSGAAPPR